MAESELRSVLLQTTGRGHQAIFHALVALFAVAATSELNGLWRHSSKVGRMARALVWFALPATLAAAFSGWTMSEPDPVSQAKASNVEWYCWAGVCVLALPLLCVLLRLKTSAIRCVLFCGATGGAVTGHLGCTMGWGEGYLLEPTLVAGCVSYHGPEKKKGGLRLETIAEAFREGEVDRRTILPGEPAGILLVKRIKVSDNDDDVIPPWDELLTKENISIVHLWIARGANYTN